MALLGTKLPFLVLKWHFFRHKYGTFRCPIVIFSAKMALLVTQMALLGAKLPFFVLE